MISLEYYGHSNFRLTKNDISLLFDPFFTGNPVNTANPEEIDCKYILVSHAHGDHIGDAISIAKRTGATIISSFEIAVMAGEEGCKSHGMHIGGKHSFEFGSVRLTTALHGSGISGGHACGFVVNFFGINIYFAGDTGLFGDMELIGRMDKLDYALLPIGDNYTMGPNEAAQAAGLLKPKAVIPMHYNTWPLIDQSPEEFKKNVEGEFGTPVHILTPGETLRLA
ncbi:MAG TPA: metal-dependent hydrolase [Spirochaetia bacterium]|nr:metal-dependent hydrolase [Spirochaetia bacterium]